MNSAPILFSSKDRGTVAGQRGALTYGFTALFLLIVLAISSVLVALRINPQLFNPAYAATTPESQQQRRLHFLKSSHTIAKMYAFGLSEAYYLERLDELKLRYEAHGYQVRYVDEADIATLPTTSVLVAMDAMDLDDQALEDVKSFVSKGGFLLFNYHFAYHNGDRFRGNQAVRSITGLQSAKAASHLKIRDSLYIVPNSLSPLAVNVYPKGSKIALELYDKLPLYRSSVLEPDAIMTNWTMTSTLSLQDERGQTISLPHNESGVLWHGRYGRGNWVYSSLPSYSLFSSTEAPAKLESLLKGIAEYAFTPLLIQPYLYLDTNKVVFVSEDTEFKFDSLAGFVDLSRNYQVPVTAFLVADLANRNQELVKASASVPLVEMGSHSYTHKKIVGTGRANTQHETAGSKQLVEQISGRKVLGFRPPREELDEVLSEELAAAGYRYVLEKRKDFLYPTVEPGSAPLYTIPRSATDDFLYLVKLDWNPQKIYQRMVDETELLSSINGIYSLSIHTHLMAYKSNLNIIEDYFRFLKNSPQLTPLSGADIISRVEAVKQIAFKVDREKQRFAISISNLNPKPIERLRFRIHWPAGKELQAIHATDSGPSASFVHNQLQGYTDVTLGAFDSSTRRKLVAVYQ